MWNPVLGNASFNVSDLLFVYYSLLSWKSIICDLFSVSYHFFNPSLKVMTRVKFGDEVRFLTAAGPDLEGIH